MQNEEKIIQAIEQYLKNYTVKAIGRNGAEYEIYAEWPGLKSEIAREIAFAIAPHLEAGAGVSPTKFEKNNLPDDVKLSFHKGVNLYQCIQSYELGVITKDEFIIDMRKIEAK